MTTYVRGELAVLVVTIADWDGSTTQPDHVYLTLSYTSTSNVVSEDTVPATYDAGTGVWSAIWDTNRAKINTTVYWTINGEGTLQGAKDGEFKVRGNASNTRG
jgi:hypothetical protein